MTISKKVSLISLLLSPSLCISSQTINTKICNFNPQHDTKPILTLFEKNWDRLTEDTDKTLPAFMLKHRSYDTNPKNFGSLHIKVLHENNKLAGFAAYYIEKPQKGQLLLLAVGENFRGKGYGKALMQCAMKELFSIGASHITIWTDTDNVHAQRIYKDLGFKGTFNPENGHMMFTYWPQ
ncbi:MAG TPA: GNAT family N-acetyltransferase [Candidatus Babeliales bacterium]|jgi:ribosomal protein S18 acetylase RimI-like enzyme|nr:GNAT family N-acetyltransferase [Candidatus Babeliales bacterium]